MDRAGSADVPVRSNATCHMARECRVRCGITKSSADGDVRAPPQLVHNSTGWTSGGGLLCALHMLLVIDNYDSFTYNLVQYLGEMNVELQVHRNDQITVAQIEALKPERILISPVPCSPRESGLSNDVIRAF